MSGQQINFAEVLARIGYGTDTPQAAAECMSLCQKSSEPGAHFRGNAGVWTDAPARAAHLIATSKLAKTNLWFGINALGKVGTGRGTAEDVIRLAALPMDLDIKEGGCPDPEAALAIIDVVSEVIGEPPVAVIHSGHGYQPLWAVEVASALALTYPEEAKRLLDRFKALTEKVAADQGCGIDSVFDLPRVLRLPGSVNYKDPENPVPAECFAGDGKPLTVEQITAALDATGIPEEPVTKTSSKKPRAEKKPKADKPPLYAVSAAMTPGRPSPKVRRRLAEALADVSIETDRHHKTRDHTLALLRYGYNGELGVGEALEALYRHFVVTVGPDRPSGREEAAGEFADFVGGAEELLAAQPPLEPLVWPRRWVGGESSSPGVSVDLEGFWELTPTLRHVRDFAHARLVGPWAVLGVLLARVLAVIPPTVQLPPWVGGNASLNLFVALVGLSGDGKGATEKAAKAAVRLGPVYSTGVGSGEGIGHLFAHYDRKAKETVIDRWSVYFSVPEVDTLGALKGRTGSTLLPQLRKAWDGSDLTFGYVDRIKSIVVGEHTYRLVMVVGVQPGRASTLLGDVDAGTPQRYLWLPSLAPDQPEEDVEPPEPLDLIASGVTEGWPGMGLRGRLESAADGEPPVHVLGFPSEARDLIRTTRKRKNRGEFTDPALDGHLGLCRMKAAAALALLHGERRVTPEMWEMSAVLMEMSQATRRSVEAGLAEKERVVNQARGKAEGERSAVADEVRYDTSVAKTAQKIVRGLSKYGNGTTGTVCQRLNSRYRDYFEAALDVLVESGSVVVVGDEVKLVAKC